MAHVSLRVTDEEKEVLESYAKMYETTVSEVLKKTFFEMLEDEFDLTVIEEYEKGKPHKTYTLDEVAAELGLTDEI